MPPWNELVIYELHVGTFNDDAGGRRRAASTASIERLDHLRDLGVNAIELMPSAEFAGDFSWGYNPAHIFAVESAYGGPEALKELVRAAHQHGIAVILDVVYNHFGPTDLDLWRFDGWSENGKGGIYFYNDWRVETPWGDTRPGLRPPEVPPVHPRQRPDVAGGVPRRRAALGRHRLHPQRLRDDDDPADDLPDGWRLMPVDQRRDRRSASRGSSTSPRTCATTPWITAAGRRRRRRLRHPVGRRFVHPVREAVIAQSTTAPEHGRAAATPSSTATTATPSSGSSTPSRHDEVANGNARVPEEIAPGDAETGSPQKRSTLGAALVFTAPGIPMLFQGQEFLEDEWFHDDDPLDWTQARRPTPASCALYRDLIRLRRNWYDTTRGLRGQHVNVHHVNDDDNVIAFHRWDARRAAATTWSWSSTSANRATTPTHRAARPGRWRVRFNSDWARLQRRLRRPPQLDTTADDGRETACPTAATSASAATRRSSSPKTPSETGQQPQR